MGYLKKPLGLLVNLRSIMRVQRKMAFTKVSLVKMNMENTYPDYKNSQNLSLKLHQAVKDRISSFKLEPKEINFFKGLVEQDKEIEVFYSLNLTKTDFLAIQAKVPISSREEPYGENDISLLAFLRHKFSTFDDLDVSCKKVSKEVVSLYYVGQSCIKIALEDEVDTQKELKGFSKDKALNLFKKGLMVNLGFVGEVYLLEKRGNHDPQKLETIREEILSKTKAGKKPLPNSQTATKEKADEISCFFMCNVCKKLIGESTVVTKKFGNMSFLMYLFMLGESVAHKKSPTAESTKEFQDYENRHACDHPQHARVFRQGSRMIKFSRHNLEVFELFLKGYDSPSVANIRKLEQEFRSKKVIETNRNFVSLLAYIASQLVLVTQLSQLAIQRFEEDVFEAESKNLKCLRFLREFEANLVKKACNIAHYLRSVRQNRDMGSVLYSRDVWRFVKNYTEIIQNYSLYIMK